MFSSETGSGRGSSGSPEVSFGLFSGQKFRLVFAVIHFLLNPHEDVTSFCSLLISTTL